MNQKMTTDEFIQRANIIYNNKYDYSKTVYNGIKSQLIIICPEHGEFIQRADNHLEGRGCKYCKERFLTTDKLVKKAKELHPEYDYSKTIYNGLSSKVIVICPKHGEFEMSYRCILRGHGCPKCADLRRGQYQVKIKTVEDFIEAAKKNHGDKYDYSKVIYKGMRKSNVEIICPKHGSFFMLPKNHLLGCGCKKCADEKSGLERRMTNEEFIAKAKKIHGNKYNYSKINYSNCDTKVEIICQVHGSFWQTPYYHLRGRGCPICKESQGERIIRRYLESNNIIFEAQKKFDDLKDKSFLSYDFFLPEKNILIEYNGIQHYEPVEKFGGEKQLHLQRHHDWLKRKYAREHNFKLITIRYDEEINLKEAL